MTKQDMSPQLKRQVSSSKFASYPEALTVAGPKDPEMTRIRARPDGSFDVLDFEPLKAQPATSE